MTLKICAFQPAQLAHLAPDWMCVCFIKDQCSKCFKSVTSSPNPSPSWTLKEKAN